MQEFLQHTLNGLSIGSIYALLALGYTMVYGILGMINFAHSEIYMMGAFGAFYTARFLDLQTPSILKFCLRFAGRCGVCDRHRFLSRKICL